MNGVVIIDKPPGLTSHDVVGRVRRILGERSIGHLGTLDPMATGVLPLVVGNFTRLAQFYLHSEKSYEGTIRFGFSTDTYDAEGDPTSSPQDVSLDKEKLELVIVDRFPFRAGWFSQLHILRSVPNHARFPVGESFVVCCRRSSARPGSVSGVWQTAGLSGQNLRSSFGHVGDSDAGFVFLHILLRTATAPAFDWRAADRTKSA